MVDFKRKKGESFESFLRRFNKALIKSRKLHQVRSKRYLSSKKNKNKQKQSALKGLEIKKRNVYLRKIGKLEEENKRRW